jgi:hypothetical protein
MGLGAAALGGSAEIYVFTYTYTYTLTKGGTG